MSTIKIQRFFKEKLEKRWELRAVLWEKVKGRHFQTVGENSRFLNETIELQVHRRNLKEYHMLAAYQLSKG